MQFMIINNIMQIIQTVVIYNNNNNNNNNNMLRQTYREGCMRQEHINFFFVLIRADRSDKKTRKKA